ncbi:phospholipase A and acyltransferase 3-like [Hemicordylus capensis]|uniref:phospholipase A and acyltransferase 3-like n=1 Tax=Hemicordylus capensis TaxID=884348 RepID=UPI002303B658|nr:phospholipase A and acyltransferase 3-like [Hemicordylus capensis]
MSNGSISQPDVKRNWNEPNIMGLVHGLLRMRSCSISSHWTLSRCSGYLFHQVFNRKGNLVPQEEPEPGDLVEIFRGFYSHWAVYVGDGFVVHLTSADKGLGDFSSLFQSVYTKKAVVKKELLKNVAGKHNYRVNNNSDLRCCPKPLPYILHEAEASVGETMDYAVASWNCEHFAKYLRYGIPVSEQIPTPEDQIQDHDDDWDLCLDLPEVIYLASTGKGFSSGKDGRHHQKEDMSFSDTSQHSFILAESPQMPCQ